MGEHHTYTSHITWTGNLGEGTRTYSAYRRDWTIEIPGKPAIACSNDPLLGGNPHRMNPEDLLLSALSACHMLWYLHLASQAGICVLDYRDTPEAIGEVAPDGSGQFVEAILSPKITLHRNSDPVKARALHSDVHRYCFIARSVAFPVRCVPCIELQTTAP